MMMLSEKGGRLFADTEDVPLSFSLSNVLMQIFSAIALLVSLMTFSAVSLRLQEGKKSLKHKGMFETAWWIRNQSGLMVLQYVVNLVSGARLEAANRVVDTEAFCLTTLAYLSPTIYLGIHFCNYRILLHRASIACGKGNRKLDILYFLTKLSVLFGVPLTWLVGLFGVQSKAVFGNTQYCVQHVPVWLNLFFFFSSNSLSLCFLLLFLIPILEHAQSLQETQVQTLEQDAKKMRQSARRVFFLSLVQIAGTFFSLVIGSIITLTLPVFDTVTALFWQRIQYTLYAIDLLVNLICILLMSNVWYPRQQSYHPAALLCLVRPLGVLLVHEREWKKVTPSSRGAALSAEHSLEISSTAAEVE